MENLGGLSPPPKPLMSAAYVLRYFKVINVLVEAQQTNQSLPDVTANEWHIL